MLSVVATVNGHAQTDVFDLTPHSFTTALNWYLQQRKNDKVVGCHAGSAAVTCRFTNHRFRHLGRALQRVDGTSQQRRQTMALRMQLQQSKLSAISLIGDCADPVATLTYVSTLSNIMRVFEPTLSDGDAFATAHTLGLTADGDLTGRSALQSHATIACHPTPAGGRRAVTCVLTPGM